MENATSMGRFEGLKVKALGMLGEIEKCKVGNEK